MVLLAHVTGVLCMVAQLDDGDLDVVATAAEVPCGVRSLDTCFFSCPAPVRMLDTSL